MARQRRTAAARRAAAARRTDTKDPSRSRERALRVLFQADVRGVAPSVTLARLDADPAARALLDERDVLTEGEPVLPEPIGGVDVGSARGRPSSARDSSPSSARDRPPSAAEETPTGRGTAGGAGASGWSDSPVSTEVEPLDGFTRALVRGVEEHRAEVEGLIARYARRWAISRMPVVDRNVLRLATYELLHEPTPPAVVLDEAIGLAKRMSTDDSGRFVNGVLESIRQQLAEEAAAASAESAPSDESAPSAEAAPSDAAAPSAEAARPASEHEGASTPPPREGEDAPGHGPDDAHG